MKIFYLHVVSVTFIVLDFFLWPNRSIGQCSKTDYCHDYHGNEHHHEYHFFGPYKDLVTPIKNIALTIIPQPKMIAELGSLKNSISPILLSPSFNYPEST